jgi:hypothetical protein
LFDNSDPTPEVEPPADATQVMTMIPPGDLTFDQPLSPQEGTQGYRSQQGQQQQLTGMGQYQSFNQFDSRQPRTHGPAEGEEAPSC